MTKGYLVAGIVRNVITIYFCIRLVDTDLY